MCGDVKRGKCSGDTCPVVDLLSDEDPWGGGADGKHDPIEQMQVSTVVPPTHKPNARSLQSKALYVDI